jgi:hypothetical protein
MKIKTKKKYPTFLLEQNLKQHVNKIVNNKLVTVKPPDITSLPVNNFLLTKNLKPNVKPNVKPHPQNNLSTQINPTPDIPLSPSIKKIVNVYQPKYNNNKYANGLGDFIRGSYFIIQFCIANDLKYTIDFSNHPISKFLKNSSNDNFIQRPEISEKINKFEDNNFQPNIKNGIEDSLPRCSLKNEIKQYLNSQIIYNNAAYIYTNAFPNNNPNKLQQDYIKYMLEPVDEIYDTVNTVLKTLSLRKQEYMAIHIRLGDKYINTKELKEQNIINKIKEKLRLLNQNKNYLLISDNNNIKNLISYEFPFIKIFTHEITHTGEGFELNDNSLKNTLVDFYLMSCSSRIMSFSTYNHGSGFSKWCASTFDLSYVCFYISV